MADVALYDSMQSRELDIILQDQIRIRHFCIPKSNSITVLVKNTQKHTRFFVVTMPLLMQQHNAIS